MSSSHWPLSEGGTSSGTRSHTTSRRTPRLDGGDVGVLNSPRRPIACSAVRTPPASASKVTTGQASMSARSSSSIRRWAGLSSAAQATPLPVSTSAIKVRQAQAWRKSQAARRVPDGRTARRGWAAADVCIQRDAWLRRQA
jgi:hypothetical protein